MIFDNLRELYAKGWNPVPLHVFLSQDSTSRQKRPPVKWKQFADTPSLYSLETIDEWESTLSNAHPEALGVALITGLQRDGTFVVCVDLDIPKNNARVSFPDELIPFFSSTMSTITPSGGRHYYFKYSGTLDLINQTNIFQVDKLTQTAIDLRATSGLSVIAPTRIWEWNWDTDRNRKTTPLRVSPSLLAYSTLEYLSPNELPELPEYILDAFIRNKVDSSTPDTPEHAKRLYHSVIASIPPDSSRGESYHSFLLSWSAKLISTYLPLINTEEDANALYSRFRNDIQFLVDERKKDSTQRQLEEPYLEKLFYSGIQKLKKNRDLSFRLAQPLIDPLLQKRVALSQVSQWDGLQVTQILDYQTHLYLTNEDSTKGFELQHLALMRQQEWRTRHLIAFGHPILPKIKTASFELAIANIPILQRENTASSPRLAAQAIISDWFEDVSTVADEVTKEDALKTAVSMGYSGFTDPTTSHVFLFFKLRAMQEYLRDEGLGNITVTKLAQIMEELKAKPLKDTPKIWCVMSKV